MASRGQMLPWIWWSLVPVLFFLIGHSYACSADSFQQTVRCYNCIGYDDEVNDHCIDPYKQNKEQLVMCRGLCVKWIREVFPGIHRIIRTCSNDMNINMNIYKVCMQESTTGKGKICFCGTNKCNRTQLLRALPLATILMAIMASLVMS